MIRRGLIGGGILVIAGYLGIAGYLYMTDNTRNNTFISEAKTPNQQVSNILYQKGVIIAIPRMHPCHLCRYPRP